LLGLSPRGFALLSNESRKLFVMRFKVFGETLNPSGRREHVEHVIDQIVRACKLADARGDQTCAPPIVPSSFFFDRL